jgi:hypothetical protein
MKGRAPFLCIHIPATVQVMFNDCQVAVMDSIKPKVGRQVLVVRNTLFVQFLFSVETMWDVYFSERRSFECNANSLNKQQVRGVTL